MSPVALIVLAALLVPLAGLFAAADAALNSVSRARVETLVPIMASFSVIGVATEYGWIELTRMPYSPASSASEFVRAVRPCLDAA